MATRKVACTSAKKDPTCPIVGIGGSAGGFEATMDLLRHLPAKNGMTFVVVQHLDPHHVSKLASLLGRATAMPVIEITKTTEPKPNTVYVQPPNKCVVVKDGTLKLVRRTQQLNVAIDQFFESHVRQFRGRTEAYLQHHPGPSTLNLLQLVRPSLATDLRNVIRRCIKMNKAARKERSLVEHDGRTREINIQVVPFDLSASDKSWLLVIFDQTTQGTQLGKVPRLPGETASQREIAELSRELAANKEALQAIVEEQEATNEELKSANEEIESSNEELQSTNEELETAKEELQSTNEELVTLNEELSNRNVEMQLMNSDLNNLLASIQLPIVMVDTDLLVRRVTPAARKAFNILQSDVGRPISDFRPNVDILDLEDLLREVIETLAMRERRVSDKEGHQYSLRARPYRTSDNKIDGAVITLVDMDAKGEPDGSKAAKHAK